MRWLLVVGVSLDLSGALLMASAVLGRSAGENREEATTRYDHNFWVVLIREREQSRVRVGALLLGLGFVLQAIGFLLGFGGLQIAVASLAAIATIAVAYAIGLCLAEARVPLKYHESLLLPAGIQDERHVYRLADEKEVHEWRRLHSLRILGHGLEITGQAVSRVSITDAGCSTVRSVKAQPRWRLRRSKPAFALRVAACSMQCFRATAPRSNAYCCPARSRTGTGGRVKRSSSSRQKMMRTEL